MARLHMTIELYPQPLQQLVQEVKLQPLELPAKRSQNFVNDANFLIMCLRPNQGQQQQKKANSVPKPVT